MRFNVVGPLTVSTPDGPVELASGASRTVLALLLLHRNAAVAAGRLAEVLWGEHRPPSAAPGAQRGHMRMESESRGTQQSRASRLRPPTSATVRGRNASCRVERPRSSYGCSLQADVFGHSSSAVSDPRRSTRFDAEGG